MVADLNTWLLCNRIEIDAVLFTSSWGLFGTRIFRHVKISAGVYFGTMDILAQGHYGTGTFRHKDISAHGYFGTYTFWYPTKQFMLSLSEITFFLSDFYIIAL